ncbi:DUF4880 domain-containing protein [Pseudomonas sp. NPDC007930]|uniref:DUF4880 domain-containing protein n=1 Tax=Pseudomonas sp. NPDC007930 TaxID=3364417 RepID=UPI0036E2F17D
MSAPSRAALEQAIEWSANLRDETLPAHERRAFERWLAADPSHATAWQLVQGQVQRVLAPLGERHALTRQTLQAPRPSRRHLLRGALALAGVGVASQLLRAPGMPLAGWGADLHTGTAQRLSQVLADGSRLTLDACSAVNLPAPRQLNLLSGKLIIDASAAAQPLCVFSRAGQVQCQNARVMVALGPQAAHVWALRGSATLINAAGARLALNPGEGARLAEPISPLAAHLSGEAQWQDGWLNVIDWPLGDLLAALRPYRHGVLRASPEAAALRVSGVFSLDNSDRALITLAQTLPLRLQRLGPWWVSLSLA